MLPTSSDVTFQVKPKIPAAPRGVDAVVAFVTQGARDAGVNVLAEQDKRAVARLLAAKVVRGKAKEIGFDLVDAGGRRAGTRRVYVVGLGPAEKVNAETIRQSAGALAKAL